MGFSGGFVYGRKLISGSWFLGENFGLGVVVVVVVFFFFCLGVFCFVLSFFKVLGSFCFECYGFCGCWVFFCLYRAFRVFRCCIFKFFSEQTSKVLGSCDWLIVCALCVFLFVCVSWFFFRGGRGRDKELWLWRLRRRMFFWEERGRRYWFRSSSRSGSDGRKKIGLERGRSSWAEHTCKGSWRFVVI